MAEAVVLSLFALALFGCVVLGVSVLWALVFGLLLFMGYGMHKGHSIRALLTLAVSGIKTVKSILVTFVLIGVITALWRVGGTIPYIICRALPFCDERIILLAAFLLCSLISFLTGTAFGTAATVGVICSAIAAGMGVPAAYVGGAVLSGSYFGDRCSPMSTSALLVSTLTDTDLFHNLRAMAKTAFIPFAVTAGLYTLLGHGLHGSYDVSRMQALFASAFTLRPVVLIPAAVIVVLSLFRVNVKLTMGVSILCSAAVCLLVQGTAPSALLSAAVLGFQPESGELAALLSGGGIVSMVKVFCIVCISSCYPGIFDGTGLLDSTRRALGKLCRRVSPFGCILLSSVLTAVISCNQTLTVMLTQQLCLDLEHDSSAFALDLEDSAIVIAPLVPWSIAGAVPLASVGAPTVSIIFAFYLYLIPLCSLIAALCRRNNAKKPTSR